MGFEEGLPIELQEHIIEYVCSDCYLKSPYPTELRLFLSNTPSFTQFFKCYPAHLRIGEENIEYCLHHDKTLLENSYRILSNVKNGYEQVKLNFGAQLFTAKIVYNDREANIPLSAFGMEPYISIMDDHSVYYLKDYKDKTTSEINDRVIKPIFSALDIIYSGHENGMNSQRLIDSVYPDYDCLILQPFESLNDRNKERLSNHK